MMNSKRAFAIGLVCLFVFIGFGGPLWSWIFMSPDGYIEVEEFTLKPSLLHISLTNDPSEIVIVWATNRYSRATILYSQEHTSFSNIAYGQTRRLSYSNYFGMHYWHRVVLRDLKPNTRYRYQAKCGDKLSSAHHFFVRPSFQTNKNTESLVNISAAKYQHSKYKPAPSLPRSTKLLVFGDFGLRSRGISSLIEEGLNGGYSAALHIGDIAYSLHGAQGRTGDEFLATIEPLASAVPYMTTPGNHDTYSNYLHYTYRFSMPSADGSTWPMNPDRLWYSFDLENVHIISINTGVYFYQRHMALKQFSWLVTDLKAANENRRTVPWIILIGHRPLYCSMEDIDDCNNDQSILRSSLDELIYSHGVDLVISAHSHLYERSWPLLTNGRPERFNYHNPRAPVYVINGAMGRGYKKDVINSAGDWSAKQVLDDGFGRLTVLNSTHLHYEQLNFIISKNSTKLGNADSFMIVQDKVSSHGPNADTSVYRQYEISSFNFLHSFLQKMPRWHIPISREKWFWWGGCILLCVFVIIAAAQKLWEKRQENFPSHNSVSDYEKVKSSSIKQHNIV